MSVKPFTLNYFVLSTLGREPEGLDLNGLKLGLINSTNEKDINTCLLYTSPSPRDQRGSRMPSSA